MSTSGGSGAGNSLGGVPVQHGAGTPAATVTPTQLGAFYVDTTTGALYSALGATSADWCCIGGNGDHQVQGYFPSPAPGGSMNNIAPAAGGWEVIDPVAYLGTGNGVQWQCDGMDGNQELQVAVGPIGGIYWRWNNDGRLTVRVGGIDLFTVTAAGALAMWGATPPGAQPAAIAAPAAGVVIDVQARAAIVSILNAIGAGAGGIGITA